MDIKDVLLTEKQKEHITAEALSKNPHWQPDAWGLYDEIAKAQCLKLLKVLENEGKIKHHCTFKTSPEHIHTVKECIEHCWLCKLKKDLKGEN